MKIRRTLRHANGMGQNRFTIVFLSFVVALMFVMLMYRTSVLKTQAAENDDKIAILNEKIAEEQKRAEELNEEEQYMQTKAYVEDVAHEKLGLVYPDEIFIKVNED